MRSREKTKKGSRGSRAGKGQTQSYTVQRAEETRQELRTPSTKRGRRRAA